MKGLNIYQLMGSTTVVLAPESERNTRNDHLPVYVDRSLHHAAQCRDIVRLFFITIVEGRQLVTR